MPDASVACAVLPQDMIYSKMDDGVETVNVGLTQLAVVALVRATCQRPGSMGLDNVDLAGKTVWGPGKKNVLSVKNVTISRTGMTIELSDGSVEEGAERMQLKYNRIKHRYYEAAAGGYEVSPCIAHPSKEAIASFTR